MKRSGLIGHHPRVAMSITVRELYPISSIPKIGPQIGPSDTATWLVGSATSGRTFQGCDRVSPIP